MSAYPLRFARLLLVQMTTVMLTLASFAYWESQRTMELVLTHVPDFPAVGHELHQTNQAFLAKMILVIAAAAIVQLFFGFYMSSRFAGPMTEMVRQLDDAAEGRFGSGLSFDETSPFHDVGNTFDGILQTLSSEQGQRRGELAEIESLLQQVRDADSEDAETIAELRERLAHLAGVAIPATEKLAGRA